MSPCFRCGNTERLEAVYGYPVCPDCRPQLGLYADKTIQKHIRRFADAARRDPENLTYAEEVERKLLVMERDYIARRIKLLHLQERIIALDR